MGLVLRKVFSTLTIVLGCLMACARPGLATTVIVPSDEDLIVGARSIVRGRVLSIGTSFDEQRDLVFTYVTLRVHEVLKGQITARKIVIKEPGGLAGDKGTLIFGLPRFAQGENVLVYLDTWADGSLRVHQMFLGKFSIVSDPDTGQLVVVRDNAGAHVEVLTGSTLMSAESNVATDRMELSAYTAMVRAKLAEKWDRAQEFERAYYSGIPILSRPPEYEAKARSGQIEPQFTLLNPSAPPRWFEPDSGQPVVFFVKPDGAPSPQVVDDVAAAMNAWSGVPGSSLRVVSGGTTSQCAPSNGVNTIVFNNCDSQFSPSPTCSGVLAVGGIFSYTTSSSKVIGGTTFYRALQGHVSFNPYASCHFSQHCNVQEVATHELGHTLGFGHSDDPTATMYFQVHFDGRCASLQADDMSAATFVYPASGGSATPTITTPSPLPGGTAGSPYSQTLTASGGTPPYSWSIVGGALPTGLSLSSSGAIAGTPSSVGASNFTVQVSDFASQTAQKAFSLTIAGSGPALAAQFVSQDVPASVQPGQPFNVTMIWANTGSSAWSESASVRVSSQNPANNVTWGGNRIILPSAAVIQPGQQLAVTVTLYAPPVPGTYNFQWQMIKEGTGFFGQPSPNLAINVSGTTLTITGPSVLEAISGSPFSYQLAATGGTQPYTWSIVSGALPAGLTLNPATGVISGTPPVTGGSSFTAQVKDSSARAAQKPITITVSAPPLQIATSTLATAVKGSPYNQQLAASGGVPPYTWSLTVGALPAGLSLNQNTGAISGTPTVTGSFPLTAGARDQAGNSASRSLFILVVGPEAVPHITRVKYKATGKLIVTGDNFSQSATLLIDEQRATPRYSDTTSFVVKPLVLPPGDHAVRVVNPNGISSETARLTVN